MYDQQVKASDTTLAIPPTCMAAHANDDFNEQNEPEENSYMEESPKNIRNDLPLPPPPPLLSGSQNNYRQVGSSMLFCRLEFN